MRPRYSNGLPVNDFCSVSSSSVVRAARSAQRGAEHLELAGDVAVRDDEVEATARDGIDDGGVLSEFQRIVERGDERADEDAHVLGAGGHGRGQRERARQVAVRRAVVLGQDHHEEAALVGPLGHVQGSRVAFGDRDTAEVGVAQVKADGEEGHGRQVCGVRSQTG